MRVRTRQPLGQIEPALSTATDAPAGATSPFVFYFVAVAAGVTVWYLTRWLDRKGRKS